MSAASTRQTRSKRLLWIGKIALALALAAPLAASAWWNPDWTYRKHIDLSGAETPALGAQVQQVLVPVRLHAGNFPFAEAQVAGNDLRFVAADDKTPLNFHIEQFDAINEIAIVWVQAPAVGSKDAAMWLYYGNPNAPAAGSAKASFDPTTVAAFHFGEREGLPRDSTGYGNTVVSSSGKLGSGGVAAFGIAMRAEDSLRIAAAPALATPSGTGWTVSMWVKAEQAAATGTLLVREEGKKRLAFGLDGGKPYLAAADAAQPTRAATTAPTRIDAAQPIDGGTWHHLAFVIGDRATVYVDGTEVAQGLLRLPEFQGDVVVGAPTGRGGLAAEIDELQIANRMRAPEWIRAAALAQHAQSRLLQYGGDEGGGGSDYIAVLRTLAAAVSTDGWIIIALIGVMGLISGDVMVSKMRLLRRIGRLNDAFVAEFRRPEGGLARLDAEATITGAARWGEGSLYRIYRAAYDQLQTLRGAGQRGELSPQAIEVVRAGIDVSIVGEANRLNNRLVMLTLSVSGAPFLGLLGTVVGIMVTFGTIALQGDVNVNTIAPGVAAAITTTVAGLLVAIPVMFGYNLLATRVKELTQAMEVFANELLGKLAWHAAFANAPSAAPAAAPPLAALATA